MLKKIRPSISLLAAATMAFSTIGSINIQARNKGTFPGNNTVLIGDVVMPFAVNNIINGMTYAISRGADPDDLKVIYSKKQGSNPQYYYDFGDKFSTAGDGVGEVGDEVWKNSKMYWDPLKGDPEPYEGGTTPTNSSTGIKPRAGYEGIIDISGNKVTIPANTTPKILRGAIQSDDGIFGQTYEFYDGDTKIEDDDVKLVSDNKLKVIAESGAEATYNLVVQSGGGGGQEDSADLEFKTNLDQGTLSYTAGATDVDPLTVEVQGKDGATTGTISYQWYKQTVGTSPLRATAVPVGEAIEGETSASFTPPVNAVGTTLYYVIATNTEEGKKASSIASKMVTVVVSEGELTDTEFTVSDYVYNDDSKDTKTMGKLTGTAPSGAKITIEANFTELAAVDAADGKWEATFPRQNAGTIIKVTAIADGKTKVETIEVKAADTKDIEDFRKNIDLNKLIEVRDNLKVSEDGKDVSNGYWIKSKTEADAFKAYVNLIEAVLGYKYQISTVDLDYVQNIALSTLKTYEDKIHQAGEVSTKATVSISRDGKGTVEVSYKGDSHSVTDGVYKVEADKNTSVTFKATADAGNHFVKWVVDGNDDTTSGATLTKEVKADMSVKAVFAKDGEQPVEQFTVTTLAENGKITARKADDNTPITIGADGTFKVDKGTEVVFAATADDDYKFSKWLVNNTDAGTTNTITRTIAADMTVKAEFTYAQIEEGKSRVTTVATNGSIAAEANGTSITIGTDGTFDIDDNTEVTFTATPDNGYKFSKWLVDGKDAGTATTLTKTITANTAVEAVFVKEGEQPGDTFNTTLNVTGNGVVKVTSDDADMTAANGVYTSKSGSILTFEAIPQTGYEVEWPKNVAVNGQNKNVATLGVSKDDTVTVNFVKGAEEETSTTPSVSNYEFDIEQSDAEGNLYVKLTGKAGKGAKITFKNGETEITPLHQVIAGTDGTWTAVIPRQDGGATITVIAKEEGKKEATTTYSVPVAEDKEALTTLVDDIKTGILDKITSGDIKISETGKDLVKGDKYLKPIERDAIETLNKLLSKLTGTTLSQADVNFIISTARPAFESIVPHTAEGPDVSTTSKVTLSKVGNGNITIEDKDEGAIDGDTSSVTNGVYTVNNGKAVTITAIPDASNEVAGWLIDEKPSVETSKTTRELTVNKDTSVQAIFASTEEAVKIDEVIKKVEEITNKGTTPVEVSTSKTEPTIEEVKALVESEIESKLPEDAIVSKVEVTKNETLAKATTDTISYTAKVTFKVGNVEFTITIEISVKVGETVSDVELTLDVTGAENGKVVSVKQDSVDISSESNVYTVKSGKEVTFTVDPNPGYKATWSENVKEVTTGNPNVVTITPIASETITLDFVKDSEVTDASKVTLSVGENGVVKVEVDGTSLTPTGNVYTVENGKTVTFTAIPKTGFEVDRWTNATPDSANKNVATLKVTENAEVGVTFKSEGSQEQTDAIKILSMQVDGGNFENISASVTTSVYKNTVDGAVYQIYASLSNPIAKFGVNGDAKFKFTLTAYSDSENFTGNAVTEFLAGLQIANTRKVLMKELKPIEGQTRELEITLNTNVIKSTNADNPTEFTINFTYAGSADSNILKPLIGKAIQIKATTEN